MKMREPKPTRGRTVFHLGDSKAMNGRIENPRKSREIKPRPLLLTRYYKKRSPGSRWVNYTVRPKEDLARGKIAQIEIFEYPQGMTTLLEIEKTAMQLPDNERAKLASALLHSLPSVLHDEDGGVAEALRRDAELDSDPSQGMTLAQFRSEFED